MSDNVPEGPGPAAAPREPAGETALADAFCTLCWGVLHAIGMFDPDELTADEKAEDFTKYHLWFHIGETGMAALLAGNIAVPAYFWFATITALPLACVGAAVLFLPLFVFLPKLIRSAMKADTDAVLEAFGRNEQTKKVFWALFTATAGLVLAQVLDPAAAEKIAEILAGIVPL
jgi:hypothetical protein